MLGLGSHSQARVGEKHLRRLRGSQGVMGVKAGTQAGVLRAKEWHTDQEQDCALGPALLGPCEVTISGWGMWIQFQGPGAPTPGPGPSRAGSSRLCWEGARGCLWKALGAEWRQGGLWPIPLLVPVHLGPAGSWVCLPARSDTRGAHPAICGLYLSV